MRSSVQRKSASSVVIKFADREAITRAVEAYAKRIRAEHPQVQRVIWFGSWVNGLPTPGSDVDLCVLLSAADQPLRERTPDYLPLGFPVGMDLFPYTQAEFERLRQESPTWYAAIMSGREM